MPPLLALSLPSCLTCLAPTSSPAARALAAPCSGVELLLLILKGKRAARTSALKCLDFATTRCAPACDRVVDQQGLKTLFAIFMGKLKARAGALGAGPGWLQGRFDASCAAGA